VWSHEHERVAIVTDEDARALRAVGLGEGAAADVTKIFLTGRPVWIVALGETRFAVGTRDPAAVVVLDRGPSEAFGLAERAHVALDGEPRSAALSPDGRALIVVTDAPSEIVSVDVEPMKVGGRQPLPRSPRAVALSDDGRTAYVAHATGGVASVVDLDDAAPASAPAPALSPSTAPRVLPLRLERSDLPKLGPLPLLQGFAVFYAYDAAWFPGVAVATGDAAVRTRDAYGNIGEVSIPTEAFRILHVSHDGATSPLDDGALAMAGILPGSCILPRVAVMHKDSLFIACIGPGRVYEIPFSGARARAWPVPWAVGDSVSGLAFDDDAGTVLAWAPHEGTLTVLPFDTPHDAPLPQLSPGGPSRDAPPAAVHALHPPPEDGPEERGRAIFYATNDPLVSHDGRACASCHIDGAEDGLTWPTPEGPRQTPMLAGRVVDTAPYGWTGARPRIQVHLQETIRRLGGAGLSDAQRDDVAAFLATLAPPRPPIADATVVAHGRAVFESSAAGCAFCHPSARFTDRKLHDVKSRAPADPTALFDTPSLVGVALTAPYFHDGRYATLDELLRRTDGAMGKTGSLSPEDLAALEAYLRSL
jgi:hypothetical protein